MSKDEIEGLTTLMNAHFRNVQDKLEAIEKQTNKTNGRVTRTECRIEDLEKEQLLHYPNCPVEPRVRTLEENELAGDAVKKAFSRSIKITSIVLGMFATAITLIVTLL